MSEYEQELVELIHFKSQDYPDRQDYLAALLRAADRWLKKHDPESDIFSTWDDDLCNWMDTAIRAMNAKDIIPDFPDAEEDTEDAETEEETVDEPNPEAEADPTPADPVSVAGGQADELEPATAGADAPGNNPGTSETEHPQLKKGKKPKRELMPTRYDNLTGEKDRYGVIIGTKTYDAVKMYEHGTTARELQEKIGGRFYNILQKLAKDGHKVEKRAGGGFKITHKDDLMKKDEAQ